MEDDAPPAQRLDEGAALQQVVDAVQPLVLLEARHTDVVRRVDGQGNVPIAQAAPSAAALSWASRTPRPHWYSNAVRPKPAV